MKAMRILVLFVIVLSGCSNKYVAAREEGLIEREWSVLDTEIRGQYNVGLVLNLHVKEFVEVRDSVKLRKLYESRRKRIGRYKILGGCAIAGCATLASSITAYSWMVNPEDIFLKLAWCYGIVGGVGALSFIGSGVSDVVRFERTESEYIKKNIICKKNTLLKDEEVKIRLKNSSSEKVYYTDNNGIIQLKFDEFIPEPAKADSILNLIIQYEELVDSVKVKIGL